MINKILFFCILNAFGFQFYEAQNNQPNIIIITLDDMNWDSAGIYGNTILEITPNIDQLGKEGLVFEYGYVQASNCSPSRGVIMSGMYPHQSGMRGFYYVKPNQKTLPEILKDNGYFTGVINKTKDSSLSPNFDLYWDTILEFNSREKRSAPAYGTMVSQFLGRAKDSKKPFFCVVNIADPHKPFFNDDSSRKIGFDAFKPSKIYSSEDIEMPEFLPNKPKIKNEIINYYNSVKRGDDCVGYILESLKKSTQNENSIIFLLSDHGMPLPFAKSTVYQNGLRVPFLMHWPNQIFGGKKNNKDLVSAIDIGPTILDILNIPIPDYFEGFSFNPKSQNLSPKYVFGQFDENAGGIPRPSRTIISNRYGYIFNAWATGKYEFKSAVNSHTSFKVMKSEAEINQKVKKRFEFWKFREIEELYDYHKDPNGLNNIIDDPKYKSVVRQLRIELKKQMQHTNDYMLIAFKNRDDKDFLNNWMEEQLLQANIRTKNLKWKRPRNNSGTTKYHTQLYQQNQIK